MIRADIILSSMIDEVNYAKRTLALQKIIGEIKYKWYISSTYKPWQKPI